MLEAHPRQHLGDVRSWKGERGISRPIHPGGIRSMAAASPCQEFEAGLAGLPGSTFQHLGLMCKVCQAEGVQGNADSDSKAWSQGFPAEHDCFLEATSFEM